MNLRFNNLCLLRHIIHGDCFFFFFANIKQDWLYATIPNSPREFRQNIHNSKEQFVCSRSVLIMKLHLFCITFLDFLMFYQIFLSPQVNRWAIITCKHSIYELPHKLPNGFRFRILGSSKISRKCLNFREWEPSGQFPRMRAQWQVKVLLILAKSSWKTEIKFFP